MNNHAVYFYFWSELQNSFLFFLRMEPHIWSGFMKLQTSDYANILYLGRVPAWRGDRQSDPVQHAEETGRLMKEIVITQFCPHKTIWLLKK